MIKIESLESTHSPSTSIIYKNDHNLKLLNNDNRPIPPLVELLISSKNVHAFKTAGSVIILMNYL